MMSTVESFPGRRAAKASLRQPFSALLGAAISYCLGEPMPKQHRTHDGLLAVAAALECHADALNRLRRAAHGPDREERIAEAERIAELMGRSMRRQRRRGARPS
jgi:hypothetical protein